MNRIENIKQKIRDNKLVKGFFLTMADTMVSEMAGYAGYDYVWIDAEHGPLDRQEIFRHIMTAQGVGCCVFVRVPSVDYPGMKALLDMGPDGIIFPFINNAKDARSAVEKCAYPDSVYHGSRGQGPIRAIRYGLDDESHYLKTAYEKVFKIMQIESVEGYTNLDEIMETSGIDSIFIGAADLRRSVDGHREELDLDVIYDDICKRTREKNLILGAAIGPTIEDATNVVGKGVQWVVFGQDASALAKSLRENLEILKDF